MINIDYNKDLFLTICKSNINRNGIDELLSWLDSSDFFTAPASSRYHLSVKGGLCQHSINVYNELIKEFMLEHNLQNLNEIDKEKVESITIISLFHDLCKVNFYKEDTRNVKNEYGNWITVPYFSIENRSLLSGHGIKSARVLSKFINLSDEEFMAIVNHMGFSSDEGRTNPNIINEVFNNYELALLLNIADSKSTFIVEKEL